MKQRLLDTPRTRVPAELAELVRAFCEPLDVIVASYVGLTEITEDFGYPREQLAVAFELRALSLHNRAGDPEIQRVADRFYESMPEDVDRGRVQLPPGRRARGVAREGAAGLRTVTAAARLASSACSSRRSSRRTTFAGSTRRTSTRRARTRSAAPTSSSSSRAGSRSGATCASRRRRWRRR